MHCPNCGLENPADARFCSNCGTAFNAPPNLPPPPPPPPSTGSTVARNIAIGCLIVIAIFLLFGLSCTRACYHMGRHRVYIHRRY